MKKTMMELILGLVMLITLLTSCNSNSAKIIDLNSTKVENTNQITVDIKGAVCFPGLYTINEGSLVIDVIKIAGGLTENADIAKINLASLVNNHEMIFIPSCSTEQDDCYSLININLASLDELMILPGIGEAKAQAIINYRNQKGYFKNIEGLKEVDGITNAIFEKVKDKITI